MAKAQPAALDPGMTLVEHLTELRRRLIISVLSIAVCMLIAFIAYNWILHILLAPYRDLVNTRPDRVLGNGSLLATDPLEGFGVRIKTAAYAGIALAMPVILWQVWKFVTPGLYPNERRYAIPFVVSALALFIMGATLAYYTLPKALQWLVDIAGGNFVTAYTAGKYFQLVVYMMLAFGIGFEFPIVLIFLQLAGVLTPDMLARARRFSIVGICILVAIITPSGDPISMLVLSVPMCIFYEASIHIGRFVTRGRRQEAAA
ncbi:MAG TPA: twin-arginine translocase subunit TatC [Acidimicrobiales bacterium]|jgi:sec-independent protein translocase protein TatC